MLVGIRYSRAVTDFHRESLLCRINHIWGNGFRKLCVGNGNPRELIYTSSVFLHHERHISATVSVKIISLLCFFRAHLHFITCDWIGSSCAGLYGYRRTRLYDAHQRGLRDLEDTQYWLENKKLSLRVPKRLTPLSPWQFTLFRRGLGSATATEASLRVEQHCPLNRLAHFYRMLHSLPEPIV